MVAVAKAKAPLLSLGAAQQLGKTLVFFPWKGINAVREYVIPTNPRTAGQTTQRGYITAAVAMIHETEAQAVRPLDEDDQVAYSALATVIGKIMTWFNMAVKLWADVKVAGNTPIIYSDGREDDTRATDVSLDIMINEETGATLAAGKFYLGKSKTNLIHSYAGVVDPGVSVNLAATDMTSWMAAGDKIYWQFRPDVADGCEGADSGIYHFTGT